MKQRLKAIRDRLNVGLIEREEAIRLALLSALAGEHLLLIGEPGTAKSALARKLHLAFKGSEYFERLLTKFSVPEELFGPLSIKALENDSYKRLTDRYLPAAGIAFIDEIFKANSAILNALLTLLNEREFDNGDARVKVPLISVIAASNELPNEEGLGALYDRFLCRYYVHPISTKKFSALLQLQDVQPELTDDSILLSKAEIDQIQQQAAGIALSDDVLNLLASLREFLHQHQLYVSDRRWRKVVKLLKVAAFTDGRPHVSVWDCWLLQHCLWHEPEQRHLIVDWYRSHIGVNSTLNVQTLEKLVSTWEQVLQHDKDSKIQLRDDNKCLLFKDRQGSITPEPSTRMDSIRDGEKLYLAPAGQEDRNNADTRFTRTELEQRFFDELYRQTHINGHWTHIDQYIANPANRYFEVYDNEPCMEPKRHSKQFIDGRIKEAGQIANDIGMLKNSLQQQLNSLEQELGDHLWLLPEFIQIAASGLTDAFQQTEQLLRRLQTVMAGYQALPRL